MTQQEVFSTSPPTHLHTSPAHLHTSPTHLHTSPAHLHTSPARLPRPTTSPQTPVLDPYLGTLVGAWNPLIFKGDAKSDPPPKTLPDPPQHPPKHPPPDALPDPPNPPPKHPSKPSQTPPNSPSQAPPNTLPHSPQKTMTFTLSQPPEFASSQPTQTTNHPSSPQTVRQHNSFISAHCSNLGSLSATCFWACPLDWLAGRFAGRGCKQGLRRIGRWNQSVSGGQRRCGCWLLLNILNLDRLTQGLFGCLLWRRWCRAWREHLRRGDRALQCTCRRWWRRACWAGCWKVGWPRSRWQAPTRHCDVVWRCHLIISLPTPVPKQPPGAYQVAGLGSIVCCESLVISLNSCAEGVA